MCFISSLHFEWTRWLSWVLPWTSTTKSAELPAAWCKPSTFLGSFVDSGVQTSRHPEVKKLVHVREFQRKHYVSVKPNYFQKKVKLLMSTRNPIRSTQLTSWGNGKLKASHEFSKGFSLSPIQTAGGGIQDGPKGMSVTPSYWVTNLNNLPRSSRCTNARCPLFGFKLASCIILIMLQNLKDNQPPKKQRTPVKCPGFEPQWILEISCSNICCAVQDLFWSVSDRCTLAKSKENDSGNDDLKQQQTATITEKSHVCTWSPTGISLAVSSRDKYFGLLLGSSMPSLHNQKSM